MRKSGGQWDSISSFVKLVYKYLFVGHSLAPYIIQLYKYIQYNIYTKMILGSLNFITL